MCSIFYSVIMHEIIIHIHTQTHKNTHAHIYWHADTDISAASVALLKQMKWEMEVQESAERYICWASEKTTLRLHPEFLAKPSGRGATAKPVSEKPSEKKPLLVSMTISIPELTPSPSPPLTPEKRTTLSTSHSEVLGSWKRKWVRGSCSKLDVIVCSADVRNNWNIVVFVVVVVVSRFPCTRKEVRQTKIYHPVELFLVISKILEKVIAEIITEHFKRKHPLCPRQSSFRKKHSTADLHLLMSFS